MILIIVYTDLTFEPNNTLKLDDIKKSLSDLIRVRKRLRRFEGGTHESGLSLRKWSTNQLYASLLAFLQVC